MALSPPRLPAVALGLVLVAGVIVIDPDGWSPFGPAKWLAVVVTGLVGLAVALGSRRQLVVTRVPTLVWGAFLVWVFVAAGFGLDPRLAWTGTPQRHFGALTWVLCGTLFLAGHALQQRGSARVLAGVAAATGGLAGVWSVAELAGWQPVRLSTSNRLVGPLGSASYLGAAEALLVPIAVGLALDRSLRSSRRLLAGAAAGLGTVALVGSGARAAWVGVVVALAAVAWARRGSLRRRQWAALAVVGTLAVTGLAIATDAAGRVPQLFETSQPGGLSRLAEWEVAGRVLLAHPVTGVGPEGYRIAFGSAVGATYQRRYGRDPLPDRAHDSLLDVAVTTGFPGLAAYLALLGLVGVQVRRSFRRCGDPWLAGVGVGLLAYGVGALFFFPIAEVDPGAWVLAGMCSIQLASPAETVTLQVPRLARLVAQSAIGAMVAWAAFFGARSLAADRLVKVAVAGAARGSPAVAAQAAVSASNLAPDNIVVRLVAAETDASVGTPGGIAAGLDELRAGLRVSPRDPVLGDELATLLVQQARGSGTVNDWRAAAGELETLRASDPRNPAVLLQLGVADASLGEYRQAKGVLEAASFLDPSSPSPRVDLDLVGRMEGTHGTG